MIKINKSRLLLLIVSIILLLEVVLGIFYIVVTNKMKVHLVTDLLNYKYGYLILFITMVLVALAQYLYDQEFINKVNKRKE